MNLKSFTLVVMTLSLNVWSTSSFASHVYRKMECRSSTLKLSYKGFLPHGGDYVMSRLYMPTEYKALPLLVETHKTPTLKDAAVIFNETSSIKTSEVKETSECTFYLEEWTTRKMIDVSLIKLSASKELGIEKGNTIEFNCEESMYYPNEVEDSCE